jgi:hypothetical protein
LPSLNLVMDRQVELECSISSVTAGDIPGHHAGESRNSWPEWS